MRYTTSILPAMLYGLLLAVSTPSRADDGGGLTPSTDQTWSRWQGRGSYAAAAPVWRSALGGLDSGGMSVAKRAGGANSLSLTGDYYFATSIASAPGVGGFRATSGLIIGPRSQASVGQPGLTTGGLFSVGSRLFGSSSLALNSDAVNDNATLPYLGVGYTGLSARSGWSFSADLGMIGQGGAANRLFGTGQRTLDDPAHDLRLTPLVQVGVLYSF